MASTASTAAAAASSTSRTWARYRDNVARHLIAISRGLQARVRRALSEERGYAGLRPSFGPFLSLIWREGRPLRDVADVLGISDQAASQLATVIEARGYLERAPNPDDRRSKLVKLTPRGQALVAEGARIILETESEYDALIGPADYAAFTSALVELYRGLDLPVHADPALPARASRSVAVLTLMAERIQRDLMDATIARGHPGLKMSHGHVLPLIGPEGGRIRDIARIQGMSRQVISAITRDLETRGYLRSEPDPRDRRGVVLTLSEHGAGLIEDAVAALADVELTFRRILGKERLADLERVARNLYHALDVEAEVLETEADGPFPKRNPAAGLVGRSGREIEQLASRLRLWLGREDAARLAAVLDPPANRGTV